MTDDDIPVGRELVTLTDSETDEMCGALDLGDIETAERIVERGYARLFGEWTN